MALMLYTTKWVKSLYNFNCLSHHLHVIASIKPTQKLRQKIINIKIIKKK